MENNPLNQWTDDSVSAFDRIEEAPVDDIWSRIQPKINVPQPKLSWYRSRSTLNIAAAIIVIFSIGFNFWNSNKQSQQIDALQAQLAQYSNELADQDATYRQLVVEKQQRIGLESLPKEDFISLFNELSALDSNYREIVETIPDAMEMDQIRSLLIRYYEHKLNILERFELEKNKINRHEKHL